MDEGRGYVPACRRANPKDTAANSPLLKATAYSLHFDLHPQHKCLNEAVPRADASLQPLCMRLASNAPALLGPVNILIENATPDRRQA